MANLVEAQLDGTTDLERLETGELNAAEARALLQRILREAVSDVVAGEVYAALRSWTGRLLRSSAGGDDLREWHNLIRATAAQFRGALADWSTRIIVLGELVYERAGMAETRRSADVLCRRHVASILRELAGSEQSRLARADLGARLGLEQANLTRVCTLLLDAGLVARREEGRSVSFELTATGALHARPANAAPKKAGGKPISHDRTDWLLPDEIEVSRKPSATSSMDAWARYDDPLSELPLAA